jgi:drug/metabolite transporter (DMT)-like permease
VAVLFCGLVGLFLFNLGIGAVTASRAGLLFNLRPGAGTLTAVPLLGESLGPAEAIGGALIVAGVVAIARGADGEDSQPSSPTAAVDVIG